MDVAVVGAGVVGLTTGLLLARRGDNVRIYSANFPPSVTSSVTCAIWLPTFVTTGPGLPEGYHQSITKWCIDSWSAFTNLDGLRYGIRSITNHEMFLKPQDPPEFLLATVRDFVATFDDSLPGPLSYRWSFSTYVIETPTYLSRLMDDFREAGGLFFRRSFSDTTDLLALEETVIFNCTGLGAAALFGDTSMYRAKGQLLFLEPVDLGFAVGAYSYCVIPRTDALILGSLFRRKFDTEAPTEDNTRRLLKRISGWTGRRNSVVFIPEDAIAREKIRMVVAGVRPYRSNGVRLAVEKVGSKLIVHNYGHGGGGITLSWGCAMEAVQLFERNV